MNEFKIEKGIPIPPRLRKSKYPLSQLEIGDSFWVENVTFRPVLWKLAKRKNIKIATRIENSGLRVWRIA